MAQQPFTAADVCLKGTAGCSAIILTNAGIGGIVGGVSSGSAIRVLADWGVLVKVSRRASIGGSWLASLDRDAFLTGPMIRYRRWLNDSASVEAAIGTSLYHARQDTYATILGMAKWNPSPVVGIALRPELRTTTDYHCLDVPPFGCTPSSRKAFAMAAGVEFSGTPGLVLSGIGAAALGVLALIFANISD